MVYVAKIRIFLSSVKKLALFLTILKTTCKRLSNKHFLDFYYDFVNGFVGLIKNILCMPTKMNFYCINDNKRNKKSGQKPA